MILYPPPIDPAAGAALAANNLSDLASAASARANLEILSADEVQIQKQLRALVISDGATTNRAQVQTGTTRTVLAGAPAATWRGLVYVPSSSSTAEIFGSSSTTSAAPSATAWATGASWSTNDLVVFANGATPATDYRKYTISSFRSTYSAQWLILEVYFVNGSTAPVVKVNDTTVAGSASDGAGPDPDWLSASMVETYTLTGYAWPSGPAPIGCWINAALSDADRTYWRETGLPSKWIVDGGSMVGKLTGDDTDFSGGAGNWVFGGGGSAGSGIMTLQSGTTNFGAGVYGRCRIYRSGIAGSTSGLGSWAIGRRMGVAITIDSATAGTLSIRGADNGSTLNVSIPVTVGSHFVEFTLPVNTGSVTDGFTLCTTTQSANVVFSSVQFYDLGALSLPIQGPDGYVLDGTRQTPANIATLTGMQWNNPVPVGTRFGITKTLAHGDISATAATTLALTLPAGWAIREVQRNVTTAFDATLTYNLGISGTPTKFINAADLVATGFAATASSVTVPQSATAGTSIYIQKSGATTVGAVQLNIIVERIF